MTDYSAKQAWTIWLITALFSLFQFFLQVASNMMTSQYMQSFHIGTAGVGALSSAFFYSYVCVQIPAGLLFDQYPLKRVLGLAVSLCGIGCALFAISPNFDWAFLSRLLMGAGGGFAFVGMVFACAESFPPAKFTLAVGLGELVGMLGTSIAQKLVPYIVVNHGWRIVMLSCALIAAALLIIMLVGLTQQQKPRHHYGLTKKLFYSLAHASRIKTAWLAGIYCCGMFAVVSTFTSLWGVPFLQAVHQLTYLQATSDMAFILLGIAIGGPLSGWLYGKLNSQKILMVGFGIGALISTLIVMFCPELDEFQLSLSLFGMGLFCSIYVTSFSVVEKVTPVAIRGTALGLCNGLALLGAIVFQPLSGWLLNKFNNYQLALLVLPVIMLIAIVSISLVPRSTKPVEVEFEWLK